MGSAPAALPTDEELDQLLEGLGSRVPDEDLLETWPVDGLIHPGITCVMGQPSLGKTTLLISLCDALLRGNRWLDRPTEFPASGRIVYFCEDHSSVARVRNAIRATGMDDRVDVFLLHRWHQGATLAGLVKRTLAALVIIDSIYPAVGDVNEQGHANLFLSAIQEVRVPVVVVHHEAKSGNGTPVGVQQFRAAYRHAIRVKRSTPGEHDDLKLELEVSGNDVRGRQIICAVVNRRSLTTEIVAAAETAAAGPKKLRRAPRPNADARAYAAGRFARQRGAAEGLSAVDYATAIVGGARGKEDPGVKSELLEALGGGGVGHQTVVNLIRDHREDFDRGLADVVGRQ